MNETMTDRELDAWLADNLFDLHTTVVRAHGSPLLPGDYPAYSSTGEGMLSVLGALRERGDAVEIVCPSALAFQVTVEQSWDNGGRRIRSESDSLPRAVAEAAKAALEAEA